MKRTAPFIILSLCLSSCATYHMSVADEAYDLLAYEEAAQHYEKALKKLEDRDATVRLAECYRLQNELDSAEFWYDRAEVFGSLTTEEHMHYAQVLMGKNDLIRARENLVRVLTEDPNNDHAVDLMFSCLGYPGFFIDTTLYDLTEVPLPSMTSAFSATPFEGGVLFVGEKKAMLKKENPWNGMSFLDLYTAKSYPDGTWSEPILVPGAVNGKFHEGSAVMGPGDSVMYFTRSNYTQNKMETDTTSTVHLQLFRADRNEKGLWGNVQSLSINSVEYSTGHPAISTDGRTLYFISDMPGGFGGTDLYSSQLVNGEWSDPVNLGQEINSQGNEMFPSVNQDTLYFSSTAHQNMGGLDVFWSVQDEQGKWRTADNMRYPINTEYDDFGMVFSEDGRSGYISSTRNAKDRIYQFDRYEPSLTVGGVVTDANTGEPIPGVQMILLDATTGMKRTVRTGPNGAYQFTLSPGKDYDLHALFNEQGEKVQMSTEGQRFSKRYEQDVQLDLPFEEPVALDMDLLRDGLPMIVENILYDFDKADIRSDAKPSLDQLVVLFNKNPDIRFELSAHTDSRASNGYNMRLSKARANSAVDYLVANGVEKRQIKAKGYGEQRLVNHCKNDVPCTRAEQQLNRRTEIRVIGGADASLVVEP